MNKQNPIITTENYIIYQDQETPTIFLLEFSYLNRSLINSLVKSKLIRGATITNNYKSLQFNATSIVTYTKYKQQNQYLNQYLNQKLNESSKIISLVTQLEYLIKNESKCFLGYNTEDLIIINDNIFIYLGCDYLQSIQNDKILVSIPFTQSDFFLSPELKQITSLPSYIHFKTCYFSLACLILNIYFPPFPPFPPLEKVEPKLLEKCIREAEVREPEVREPEAQNFIQSLKKIENTKLYYFLLRALTEEPKKRSLIYL
jgi:hypothetical protein